METLEEVSVAEVLALFDVDPEAGTFRWRQNAGRHGRIPAGSLAGALNKEGYRYLSIGGRDYRACRIMWLCVYGKWPDGQIDHRNHDTGDDRIGNLRDVTQSQNKSHSRMYVNNTSGYPGVKYDPSKSRSKWRATVTKDGKMHHCGWHLTMESAIEARQRGVERLHGEFAGPVGDN